MTSIHRSENAVASNTAGVSPPAAQQPSAPSRADRLNAVSALIFIRDRGIIVLFVVLVAIFSLASPIFGTLTNFSLILGAAAVTAIFAAGVAIGVMSGVLDLSIPGTAAVAGVITGLIIEAGAGVVLGVLAGLAAGVVVGLVNGLIVLRGLNPLVVTIGTLTVLTGLASVLSGGIPVSGLTVLHGIGTDRLAGIPAPVYVVAVLYIVGTVFLTKTRGGIRLMAVGGNVEAVRRSGVNADKHRVLGFMLSGFCAALAGIVTAAVVTQASPAASPAVLFSALTAVALSGVPLTGGRGSLPRVLVGALLIASITSFLVIKNVQPYWGSVITGALLILALAMEKGLSSAVSARLVTTATKAAPAVKGV